MNLSRRIVVVVALAAALSVVAGALSRTLVGESGGGWFMYDPSGSNVPFDGGDSDRDAVEVAVIWLAAIALWFGVAWHLFRSRGE